MPIIDLTHTITADMPVYPGTEQPTLTAANTIETDGFRETVLRLYSHTGTHMDAPAHILPDRPTLDALPADAFVGSAAVLDCTRIPPGGAIGMEILEAGHALVEGADFILFHTGWDRLWGRDCYYKDFPVPAPEVLSTLAMLRKKGVGVDAISVDPVESAELPRHRILLGAGMVIVENLTGLEALVGRRFTFCALPLKFEHADGAPVRAIALTGDGAVFQAP